MLIKYISYTTERAALDKIASIENDFPRLRIHPSTTKYQDGAIKRGGKFYVGIYEDVYMPEFTEPQKRNALIKIKHRL